MAGSRGKPAPGEIYIERRRVGQYMKVAAVDAATGVEVFVMGPLNAAASDLDALAVRKLKKRLRDDRAKAPPHSGGRFA